MQGLGNNKSSGPGGLAGSGVSAIGTAGGFGTAGGTLLDQQQPSQPSSKWRVVSWPDCSYAFFVWPDGSKQAGEVAFMAPFTPSSSSSPPSWPSPPPNQAAWV